jgi:hypothetical protein
MPWCQVVRRAAAFAVMALVVAQSGCDATNAPKDGAPDKPAIATATGFDLQGRAVNPFQPRAAKAVVFFFVQTDCPIANRYAPEMRRCCERFSAQGVAFWFVYPHAEEPAEAIRRHADEHGLGGGVLRDPQHRLVAAARARVTPEAAVFSPDGRLVYHGRIDDRYVTFGKERPAPTRRDLIEALDAMLAGKTVRPRSAPAIGCPIAKP